METDYIAWQLRSTSMGKFAPAFLKLQGELEPVKKDANNPFFKSKYAELSSILESVQPILTKHEFILMQEPGNLGEKLALTTTLMHVSGEYIRSTVAFPVVKADPQGYGSAITYARRYSLQSILGLPVVDDDSNYASGLSHKPTVQNRPPVTKPSHPSATPRPADLIPPKASVKAWDGEEIVTSGKYKPEGGKKTAWKDVPYDYLVYVIDAPKATPETKAKAEKEVIRRDTIGQPDFEAINEEAELLEVLNDQKGY